MILSEQLAKENNDQKKDEENLDQLIDDKINSKGHKKMTLFELETETDDWKDFIARRSILIKPLGIIISI